LFRTGVAALEMMGLAEGAKPEGQIDGFLVRMVGQRELPAAVRGLAMVSLGNREAASRVLLDALGERDDAVAALAARALGGIGQKAGVEALRGVALDGGRGLAVRLEALGALSGREDAELVPLLPLLEEKGEPVLVREAVRTLRGAVGNGEVRAAFERMKPGDFGVQAQVAMVLGRPSPEIRPANDEQWREALRSGGGDAAAGRRVFFSAAALCGSCHVVEGRGKAVGPDLSVIGRTVDGEKLLRSVLEPSREVGPLYGVRVATLKDGRVMSGVLAAVQDAGRLDLVVAGGAVQSALRHEVARVETVSATLMPDGLESGLTVQEFRDLMAWLATLR
jgi:putative heme-binding domain-containing protein